MSGCCDNDKMHAKKNNNKTVTVQNSLNRDA